MKGSFALLVAALTLCFASRSLAQGGRIVFFRADAESAETYSPVGEWRVYTDALIRDGNTIAKMRSGSVFVYDADHSGGNYRLTPFISGAAYSNQLYIPDLKGGICYVQISLDGSSPIKATLRFIGAADFEAFYNGSRALRRHTKEAGYPSLEALNAGFRSIPPADLLVAAPGPDKSRSLGDTLYFDRFNQRSARAGATHYSVASRDSGGRFLIRDYYLPEARLKSSAYWTTLDSESREGPYEEYFRSGGLSNTGSYRANKQQGLWTSYRDIPAHPVWYTTNYTGGQRDGMLTTYHVNGRLKREELHRLFVDAAVGYRWAPGQARKPEKDSIVSGRCYDEQGKEIPFTPFEIMPSPDFGLNEFLMKTLVYPKYARQRGIEGRVVVQFVINSRGAVRDAQIVRSANRYLDDEALRVINAMPGWKPGQQDDVPVDVYFTLPLTFRLD